ncbi:MAG: phosphate signaling complex protein PhoU [Pseudohongiellaceae bacterium]
MNQNAGSHSHHISQQFNQELEEVKSHMLEMGGMVEKLIVDALDAIINADSGLGEQVREADDDIDAREISIDQSCNRILARRQPAASDLRLILGIIKTVRDLERIGDETSKIAKMAVKLSEQGESSKGYTQVRHIGERVRKMVHMALDAFARSDVDTALSVAQEDVNVDMEYDTAMREMVTHMMEDPRSISRVLNIMWALRALERIGDHAKNICEHVVYLVKGTDVRHTDLSDVIDEIGRN